MDNVNLDLWKLLFQHQDQIKIKKRIKKKTRENRKKYLRQVELLYQHQDQICRWITIIKHNHHTQSTFLESKTWKVLSTLHLVHQLQPSTGKTGNHCEESGKRRIPSSSGPIWECDPETRRLRVQKLLGNECLDLFMPVETRSPNHVSNNKSTIKRNNETIRKLHQENREYFNKTYGITSIQGNVLLFLDDRGIMFKWSKMERGIHILGINNLEGLANYLYHPDKICRYGRHR
ncbi:unnamed protein product [Rhizophagus irregularis]|nr:unnamed protein product [Rhizophagus irregularis]